MSVMNGILNGSINIVGAGKIKLGT